MLSEVFPLSLFFYEDIQDLLKLTPKKDVLFIITNGNAKVGSQERPWKQANLALEYKMKRAKANIIFPRGHTGYSKHPLPTTQEKTLHTDITRWSILKSVWLYSLQPKMEKLYRVSKNKTRTDCGLNSDLNGRKQGKPLGHLGMT